jgi:uncharacterized protein
VTERAAARGAAAAHRSGGEPGADATSVAARVAALPWDELAQALSDDGFATTGPLLEPDECAALVRCYDDDAGFRSRVVMERHGYGRGEYRYFDYPLPALVGALRGAFYPRLAQVANAWMAALGRDARFPPAHEAWLARCRAAGQTKATPLLLRYGAGDYNCLHQDIYGDESFPLQMTFLLSAPGEDFEGGELVLTTSRPRRQSRADVVRLARGEAAIFAVRERPEAGVRGVRRVTMRHGVSRVLTGERFTLGLIFHDAR